MTPRSKTLQKMLQRGRKGNVLTRLDNIESNQQRAAFADLTVQSLDAITTSLGTITEGEFIAPASTATSADPTDAGFTGSFMAGNAYTFAEGDFNVGAVAAGLLQAGFNTAGKFLAAAGAWILDATGILVTGVQFLYNHTATVGAYARRFRQGFQEVSSKPAYLLEHIDDTAGANLITVNSDIETGSLATGFSTNTNWAASTTYKHGGSYAAQSVFTATNPLTTNKYAATAGSSYTFTVWGQRDISNAGTLTITIKWYNATPTLLQTDTLGTVNEFRTFTQKSATFVAPTGATQFEIVCTPPATSQFSIDDISVTLVGDYAFLRLSDDGADLGDEAGYMRYSAASVTMPEKSASPSTPAAGYAANYNDSYGVPHSKDDAGFDYHLHNFAGRRMKTYENEYILTGGEGDWASLAYGAGTVASIVDTANHRGVVRLSQNGANTGYMYLVSGSIGNILLGGGEVVEVIFSLPTVTATRVRMGFGDSITLTDPTDGAWINIAATTLSGKTADAGVSTTASTYTVSASTWYRCRVQINSTSLVTFTLWDAAGAVLWTDTLATNIPSTAGNETYLNLIAWKTTAGTADLLDLDWSIFYNTTALVR